MSRLLKHGLPALLLITALSSASQAQDPLERELTVAAIQSRLALVQASTKLDAAAKEAAGKQLEEARNAVQQAAKSRATADELERLTKAAPAQLAQNRAELARPAPEPKLVAPTDADLARLESLRSAAEADLRALREELDALKKVSGARSTFLQAASEQVATASGQLQATTDALKGLPEPTDLTAISNRLKALATRLLRTEELRRVRAQQASFQARRDLLQSRLDLLGRRIRSAEKLVAAWQDLESERRREEIRTRQRSAREAAKSELVQRVPALSALAERSAKLAGERKLLEPQLQRMQRFKTQVVKRLADLRTQFSVTRRKVETAGVTNALGLVLRRQLARLPDFDRLGGRLDKRQEAIAETQYRLVTLEEERAQPGVADLDIGLRKVVAASPPGLDAEDMLTLEAMARQLLKAQREGLDALKADLESHLQNQIDLDLAGRHLNRAALEYELFVKERILWVPSVARVAPVTVDAALEGLDWMFRSPQWRTTWRQVGHNGWRLGLVGLAVLMLLLGRRRIKRGLKRTAEVAWKLPRASLRQTLRATLYTVLLAAPCPLAAWGLGSVLSTISQTDVALAFGTALCDVGLTWFTLELIRQTLRSHGLGPIHFRWPSSSNGLLRRHLTWLTPILLVSSLISTALDTHDLPAWNDSLGRFAFLVEMVCLAVFLHRILRFDGALISRLLQRHSDGWMHRLRWAWYPLAIGAPLVFAVLATRGFYYTAQALEGRLRWTFVLLVGLGYLDALLERWLRLSKLRLVITPSTDPAEVVSGEAPNGLLIDSASGAVDRTAETNDLDLDHDDTSDQSTSRRQTKALFRSALVTALLIGLFGIWSSHLPALKRLDRVQVWPSPGKVRDPIKVRYPLLEGTAASVAAEDAAPKPNGGTTPPAARATPTPAPPGTKAPSAAEPTPADTGAVLSEPLSLAGLGLAILLIVFMVVAAKNLPGLVDIILNQRSSLDAGIRFAVSTVFRYMILAVGIGAALSTLGLRWDSVQWLVAALTFGLAFGLQEIFANFVSGLIILFERPIRIGDWVTVGDVSGIVTKIQIRATTVTDWDRKDLIIPNKTFVTGNIVNWALSDAVMRIQVPVGVAYGSNVELVRETLLEIARAHPDVLATPEPRAHFLAFGDSSLSFELRGFVSHPSKSTATKNNIFDAIDKRFRELGIEIAFPQRDLHVRSVPDGLLPPSEGVAETVDPTTDDAGM